MKAEASAIAANGIPAAALRAYRTAEATMRIADPSCGLSWGLLAGIGRIESDHGQFGGAVLGANGVSTPHILGLQLNGTRATAAIADTDNGAFDGDKQWDRAVGPMQFIPSTWAAVGVDGDGNGTRNPNDIDDAALAAAAYLCVGNNDLTTAQGMQTAVYSYNHSDSYVALVLGVAHAYESGAVSLPLLTATLALPTGPGTAVGLTPGKGIAIGATDEDAAPADRRSGRHGRHERPGPSGRHRKDVNAHEDVAGPGGRRRHDGAGNGVGRHAADPGPRGPQGPKHRRTTPSNEGQHGPRGPHGQEPTGQHQSAVTPASEQPSASEENQAPATPPQPETPTAPELSQEPQDALQEFTGTVELGEDGTLYLGDQELSSDQPLDAHVGQTVTVVAVREGRELMVSDLVRS